MKNLLLILVLFPFGAYAGLEKITLQNLDLIYDFPLGKGTADKVGIGISKSSEALVDIEIQRTDHSFELTTPYFDFSWLNPSPFVFDMEKLTTVKTSASIGTKVHTVESELITFRPKNGGDYLASKIKGMCEGQAVGEFKERLYKDCLNKMDLSIKKVDVPADFIFYRLLETFPRVSPELDTPGDNVVLKINEGKYYLQVYFKYWIYAGLRFWGQVQLEENDKVIAIRVDEVRFGYLTVTSFAMKKLKELLKDPNIKVDPPWIRITR